jgi:hypothetical protein
MKENLKFQAIYFILFNPVCLYLKISLVYYTNNICTVVIYVRVYLVKYLYLLRMLALKKNEMHICTRGFSNFSKK